MKKSVWITLLATFCTLAGAVLGIWLYMRKRDKELAEYEQMLINQDMPAAKWESEISGE